MNTQLPTPRRARVDVCTLEADMAFFEARLTLAGDAPDTAYQRAQIKTYRTLNALVGKTLQGLKPQRGKSADRGPAAA